MISMKDEEETEEARFKFVTSFSDSSSVCKCTILRVWFFNFMESWSIILQWHIHPVRLKLFAALPKRFSVRAHWLRLL